jgi:hypothetical protein
MAVETLSQVYTTQAEIERIYSNLASSLQIDDVDIDEVSDFWTELTEDATDIINQYAESYYDPTDMVNSRWVRTRASWVGCYLLSQRRGNPSLFADRFEIIIDELQRVYRGDLIIPRLPTREDMTPAMSNVVIDDRFRVHKIRVHPTISTGGTSGKQDLSPRFPFEWL